LTRLEVLNKITSEKKYHIGIINQSTASRTVKRIREGRCSDNKVNDFFALFGYFKQLETWDKLPVLNKIFDPISDKK